MMQALMQPSDSLAMKQGGQTHRPPCSARTSAPQFTRPINTSAAPSLTLTAGNRQQQQGVAPAGDGTCWPLAQRECWTDGTQLRSARRRVVCRCLVSAPGQWSSRARRSAWVWPRRVGRSPSASRADHIVSGFRVCARPCLQPGLTFSIVVEFGGLSRLAVSRHHAWAATCNSKTCGALLVTSSGMQGALDPDVAGSTAAAAAAVATTSTECPLCKEPWPSLSPPC
jgi:hypothetical protein